MTVPIALTQVVVSSDRRERDRRHLHLVKEPLERDGERRGEERRTSPRVAQRLWVVDPAEGGLPQVFEGEVSLGGASWWSRYPPVSGELEVRFRIPELDEELRARAVVLRENTQGADTRVQVLFTDVELAQELALARYLQQRVQVAATAPY